MISERIEGDFVAVWTKQSFNSQCIKKYHPQGIAYLSFMYYYCTNFTSNLKVEP